MNNIITAKDIAILGQHVKELYCKLEILNESLQTIDILKGTVTSGSISIDSSSNIRKTLSLTAHVKNKSYLVNQESKIWFTKYIKVSIGIKSLITQEIQYYDMGIYTFSENNFQYDSTTNSITLKCLDFMSKLIDTPLFGTTTTKILAGTNIREAMIGVLEKVGIKKYLIPNIGSTTINPITEKKNDTVPYDLSFSSSNSAYDVIEKLYTLYSGFEVFFDNDVFICQKIPTGENEQIVLDWQTIEKKQLLISESKNNSLDKVKNITQVFGKQINVDRYSDVCTNSGSQYNATFESLTALENGKTYAIKLNTVNLVNPTLKINSFSVYPIVDTSDVTIPAGTINGYSAFKFWHNKFMYLGQYQVNALAVHVSEMPNAKKQQYYKAKFNTDNISYIVNPESPYTVEKISERIDVKSGNDYDKIYSNDLCLQRAEFENWKTTRLEDSISLELQLIPWLKVDKLITYKSKDGIIGTYMIKNISIPLMDGKMKVDMIRYYPLYPKIM